MADNVIDTLSIQINSSAVGAKTAIDKLISNLTRLNGALENYSNDTGRYGKILDSLSSKLTRLNSVMSAIDSTKLDSTAKSIASLSRSASKLGDAFSNTGMDKASQQSKTLDSAVNKLAKDMMSFYGTSETAASQVKGTLAEMASAIQIGGNGKPLINDEAFYSAADRLKGILENNTSATVWSEDIIDEYNRVLDYIRKTKIPVNLPFSWRDIAGDYESALKQLATTFGVGKYTFNQVGGTDIQDYVREMNSALGTSIKVGDQLNPENEANAFEALYRYVSNARAAVRDFGNEVRTMSIDEEDFNMTLNTSANYLAQFMQNLNATSGQAQAANPFTELASGLRGLQGITVPDFSSVSTLAVNVGELGKKKALEGIANLPALASGLSSLQNLQIPEFPNIESLTNLIAAFNKLGGRKGSSASANIQPMINGLQQLSQLGSLTFPDSSQLLSLANAFSALGRETTGRAIQNIPQLAQAFRNLISTLSTAAPISRNVIDLANALANLASQGSKVGTAANSMGNSMNRMSSFFSQVNQRSKDISRRIIDFGKSLLTSGKNAEATGRSYTTLASKIGLLYAKFWMLLRVVRLFGKAISVASSLTEVQNVVDTTFGKMSYKIEEFSKNAIKGFGMSELSAKQFASQFQAMGTAMGITNSQVAKAQQFLNNKKTATGAVAGYNAASNSMADMSINLTKLAADMASFYDIEQSTVAKALQSGVMAGQTRPLRQYGLDLTNTTLKEWALNNGLNANIKTMTQAEKTMLRYQYVMANSARAQGNRMVA